MSKDNDLLNQRKESLLSELESIKYLLGDDDDIPVLDDIIIEESPSLNETPPHNAEDSLAQNSQDNPQAEIADISLPPGVLPGQQSLFKESPRPAKNSAAPSTSSPKTAPSIPASPHRSPPSQSSLADNPFLPPHVRKRFLDNAPHKHADQKDQTPDRSVLTAPKDQNSMINNSYTEQLVDQLIAHHLPKIEAQLRQKLLDVVKTHNEKLKK